MAAYTFRPAVRENVGLLIGLVGASGSGKTFTGFRLASGIAGDKRFAVIDTENRRALHYADQFRFDHLELRAPFRPQAYAEAIKAADAAGYPVIVVDSASHEHAGDGGLLDWHDEELDRIAGKDADWKRREACNMAAWIKPKMAHKQMVSELLQVRAHLILCFRAEEKVEMIKEDGKTKIVPKKSLVGVDGWIPICEKTLPFELTVSVLMTADAPGVPKPIKLQEQHRKLFPLDKQITEESGRAIAAWAAGGSKALPRETKSASTETHGEPGNAAAAQVPTGGGATTISESQATDLETLCRDNEIPVAALCKAAKVERLADIAILDLPRAKSWIDAAIERRKQSA